MRCRGEIRERLAEGLSAGAGTTREIAARTGVGREVARRTLDNMRRAAEVVIVDLARVPGVRRPVPVYGLADEQARAAEPAYDWSLVTSWASWPTDAPRQHAA